MITRSKLVEQLREYQIRSQHKWGALAAFSPKPQMTTRFPFPLHSLTIFNYARQNSPRLRFGNHLRDVFVALTFALVFVLLIVSCYAALYFRHFLISAVLVFLGILLPTCLKISRHRWLARKKERRMSLPLSM
ncbi:unnamed protein product [Musa acuminata subsp. malaccensis]|uniref:(wild Malaysian banana) hypothetical protein n=1 Tax=Musa acuminata subsp. malaccensis TaxID=214687 RepID=A0A8D6ZK28_MUSAM|nr:unnamed protein product [Musa acuminata subsp. malaccensis]